MTLTEREAVEIAKRVMRCGTCMHRLRLYAEDDVPRCQHAYFNEYVEDCKPFGCILWEPLK